MDGQYTTESAEFLEDLAEELSVPPSRYEQAERSYAALGAWLHREASTVRHFDPHVYVQGSFRLGTAIRPVNEHEEYDIDSVCELRRISKLQVTQRDLKLAFGTEIEGYRQARSMNKPLREGRRCWVLEYADGAQFHMDVVPALSNGHSVSALLEAHRFDARWASTAIAITDNRASNYCNISEDWPRSNPRGYSEWFRSRMAGILEQRKRRFAASVRASVDDVPDFKVRTPLQSAVMILKRHRDLDFEHRPDVRPISVIITTLAAHSYSGEETIGQALAAILGGLDKHIYAVGGTYWIANPTDPLENFADKWAEHPERAVAFFGWLENLRRQFNTVSRSTDRRIITQTLAGGLGSTLTERAIRRRQQSAPASLLKAASTAPPSAGLVFPGTGRVPSKPTGFGGSE